MERKEEDFLNLMKANQMLLSDWPEKKVDVLYIPGLSEGMVKCGKLFDVAIKDIYSKGLAGCIAFNGSNGERYGSKVPGEGWPGRDWYIDNLTERINDIYDRSLDNIVGTILFPTRPAFNSREETDALIGLMKKKGWVTVGFLTVAYHYPRAFVCLIQSMRTIGHRVKAYGMSPKVTDWWRSMKGSQGVEDTVPFAECVKDGRKTLDYIEKGFGCTLEELFSYLRYREKVV